MRILLTNNTLASRAGTELYVRDIAVALLRRGEHPIAYSQDLGDVAEELRDATVPVVDDLHLISEPPEVIHGHHHLETMTALQHFPGVPAVFFCHGWLPWQEAPPRHPRIVRYLAVDEVCRQRLVDENGVAPDVVEVLLNFVDLDRFRPRAALPPAPRRALFFSNYAGSGDELDALRQACGAAGLELEVVGQAAGNPTAGAEAMLPAFDVVFAKGRAALEAMAVGCATIVTAQNGCGPLVTTDNFDRLRPLNFGLRAISDPFTAEAVAAQLERYDGADAAAVSARVRREAGLSGVVDRLLGLYRDVAGGEPAGSVDDSRAMADYLRTLAPAIKANESLRNELACSAEDARRWRGRAEAVEQDLGHLQDELDRCRRRFDEEIGHLREELGRQREGSAAERAAVEHEAETRLSDLEGRLAGANAEASCLRDELERAYGTITWRARERLLRNPIGRALRSLLVRVRNPGASRSDRRR